MLSVMQWRLGAARRGQALIFYSVTGSQARQILALVCKFLSYFDPYLTFKLRRLFQRPGVLLQISVTADKPPSNLSFYLFHQVSYTRTRITLANAVGISPMSPAKEEPRHFLIYHYITVCYVMRSRTGYVHETVLRSSETLIKTSAVNKLILETIIRRSNLAQCLFILTNCKLIVEFQVKLRYIQ